MSDETSNPIVEGSGSDSTPIIPPAEPEAVLAPQPSDPVAPTDPAGTDDTAVIGPVPAEQPKVSPPVHTAPEHPALPASDSSVQPPLPDFRTRIREAKMRKREARLEKILSFVQEKGRITNDEVQKLVRVSDATATRYLHELVKRGRLTKSGGTRSVVYKPN